MIKRDSRITRAVEYRKAHPKETLTSVSEKFNVDMGTLKRNIENKKTYIIFEKENYSYYFTQSEIEYVQYFISHPYISFLELNRIFNVHVKQRTLKNWLNIMGYQYERHYNYYYNRNAFASIETEEDAYWLGFITADGYVNEKNNWLSMGIGKKDLDHLKKFLKYLDFSEEESQKVINQHCGGAYTRDNIVYTAVICGRPLIKNLKQYNLFQGKSGKEVPYICKTPELEIAYIRGLVDGDGYIRSTEYGMGLVGSKEIVAYVRNFLGEKLQWNNFEDKYIHPHGIIYKFAVGGKNITSDILHILYDNSTIHLARKYELYEKYCRV